ncbi:MAG: NAD(P)/FAD-dependent oxidoreductase [Lachnospiraceae bacterium]|nr:NAD(P)/FAD-dependent oxidoreductase [Lachnospiraceae bacterium]MBR6485069.1 NAD(P)/FAD-dependent oxidoreductase [Lachnospiraceae bacterium]
MRIVIVGGGAAGMMAAAAASDECDNVLLIDKNEKLGKKLFITGKGRCNLTNACDSDGFFANVMRNPKFMYSSFYGFDNTAVMDFFEGLGLKLKTERGDRVFPASDRSSDVIGALKRKLNSNGVLIRLNTSLESVGISEGHVTHVITDKGEKIGADRVILALGGRSYPGCGSTDDAIRIAGDIGIGAEPFTPVLVPLNTGEAYVKDLMGLSLKNVSAMLECNGKKIFEGFGEMLFTHFGVSGPLILSASSYIKKDMYEKGLKLHIDLKPALDSKQLDERLLRDFAGEQNKQFGNSLSKLLPSKLIPVIVSLTGIDPKKKVNEVTRAERETLLGILKDLTLTVSGSRGFDEAIVCRGGISVKEINPSTMECKKIKGLYFAGEMIDVDALTGGFNLQIAWSTGHLAGVSCTKD